MSACAHNKDTHLTGSRIRHRTQCSVKSETKKMYKIIEYNFFRKLCVATVYTLQTDRLIIHKEGKLKIIISLKLTLIWKAENSLKSFKDKLHAENFSNRKWITWQFHKLDRKATERVGAEKLFNRWLMIHDFKFLSVLTTTNHWIRFYTCIYCFLPICGQWQQDVNTLLTY